MVEKNKVKQMHLEISLPRMPGGEQENLRPQYAGPLHPAFGREILSVREASSLWMRILHWMADQFTRSNFSVEGFAHSIFAHRVFSGL
jgi:hypothetical protein